MTKSRSIAAALGLTEGAVNRRYRRLRADGVIRVAGVVNPGALAQSRWLVRLRCRPGSVEAIADALAKREDVNWVALGAAGCEITCATQSRTQEQREDLLGRRLPRTAAVLDINAFAMLRQFIGGRGHYWTALQGTLPPEQEATLGSDSSPFTESPVVTRDPVRLTAGDEKILNILATDGRTSLVDLATAADSTSGRVSRRLHALLSRGVVHIDVEIAAAALGYHARANLWLRVHPSEVKNAGRALAQEPEIAFAAAISGPHNIHAVAHCRLAIASPSHHILERDQRQARLAHSCRRSPPPSPNPHCARATRTAPGRVTPLWIRNWRSRCATLEQTLRECSMPSEYAPVGRKALDVQSLTTMSHTTSARR